MPRRGARGYQIFLKLNKAKTKFKAKKNLPKETNVAKTNLKDKNIIIKEQLLKRGECEPLSSRKLNVTELLSRLNHVDVEARTQALNGLSELITLHPASLDKNLGELINGVTPLLLDIEKVIRREALKLLHLILSKTSEEKVEPFYDFMSTYLRSAMTHIDISIQDDSLLFLDTLLDTCGNISQDFHKIIPIFLDIISKQRVDYKPGRTLTVNLGGQVTTVEWRVKVLQRLENFLKKFISYNNRSSSEHARNTLKYFDVHKPNYFSLYNPNYNANCPLPCFSSAQISDEDAEYNEVEQFQNYLQTLMPLLMETWLEVCPKSSDNKTIETLINEDAAVLLKHIIEVITLLWNIVIFLNKKHPSSNITNWFSQKHRLSFSRNIFKAYPYVTNITTRKAKDMIFSIFDDITDPKLVVQNLEICYLFIIFNPQMNLKNKKHCMKVLVLDYVEKTIGENSNRCNDVNGLLVKILNTLFSDVPTNWGKKVAVMKSLFKKMILVYTNPDSEQTLQENIFIILCKISLSNNYAHFQTSKEYGDWLQKLPDVLLKETLTAQTVDTVHKFAVQLNQLFNKIITSKLPDIVSNLPKIKVLNNDRSIFRLYSVLYYIHNWDSISLSILRSHLSTEQFDDESTKYIIDTLKLRNIIL